MLSKSKLKYIQTLSQKKFRDDERLFIAEGPRLVGELLKEEKVVIKELLALPEWIESHANAAKTIEITGISSDELERISQLSTPNQVLAIVEQFPIKTPVITPGEWTLVLDEIQDPGNLGTIIRLADWFGVSNIVGSTNCADVYNPKVVQSTMGSITRVNMYYTDLSTWLRQQLEKQTANVYAAVLGGKDVRKMTMTEPGYLVIGNEGRGVSADLLALANIKLTIPGKGKAESLNAAVATGILLSHLVS